MNNKLNVSLSPHVHSGNTVSGAMYGVLIALIPALCISFWVFGLGAVIVTLTSVVSCIFFEYLIQTIILKKKVTITDGSAALTGVLLAFNLPSNLPIWIIIIGALVAIAVAKLSFGGLGNNIFNPALVGRVFLLISFPVQMTSWPKPGQLTAYTDAVTAATPLAEMKFGLDHSFQIQDLLLGMTGGSLGEVSAIALLLGFSFMLYKKIITWHIPVSIFVAVVVMSFVTGLNPIEQLLAGGLMLGAIFMATDYVTSPMTTRGMVIYGVAIGCLTIIIRKFGVYPEGMSFAILIMNAFTPLINTFVKPKRFGEVVKNG
ncbi:MAG: RnfABCDGE type electron transport complex subunit D [Bacteroidales bacterium]|nr:RnfABCDGE type electron transport complex subunit D [Bacteroidales bacterium]